MHHLLFVLLLLPAIMAVREWEEKDLRASWCNSTEIGDIIEKNIVSNNARASAIAVQAAIEDSDGRYYVTVCAAGKFEYVAYCDEFCYVSARGVNCLTLLPRAHQYGEGNTASTKDPSGETFITTTGKS